MPNNQAHDPRVATAIERVAQAVGLSVAPAAGGGAGSTAFFEDGFESGDLTKTQNGFSWLGGAFTAVTSNIAKTGSNSLAFNFQAANGDGDAIAEQRFDMGALYKDVIVEFDLYIPDGNEAWGSSAYSHVSASPGNNKLIRLWGSSAGDAAPNGYNGAEKVGASLFPEGGGSSSLAIEWNLNGDGIGAKNSFVSNFIALADRGNWITIKMQFVMASAYFGYSQTAGDGEVRVWKNGTLLLDETMNNYSDTGEHAWQHGYLLGYQNSAQASAMTMNIDNVKFTGVAL